MNLAAMGKVGLTGFRGRLGERASGPVARATGLSADQVQAIIGAAFLLLTLYHFTKLVMRVARAGRSGELT